MRRFKLTQGNSKIYELTKEIYEQKTRGNDKYMDVGKDGVLRNFAICPACDNPIQIIGLYKKLENTDKPYAKHYNKDCMLAPHNETAYRFCPYSSWKYSVTKDSKKEILTDYEYEIYNTLRENIDLAIYILQQDTGILFSKKEIRRMLEEYKASEAYMYYWATLYNIPWMLLYFARARRVWGIYVRKDSYLYGKLKERKNIVLEETNSPRYVCVRSKGKQRLNLYYSAYLHRRNIKNNEVIETLKMDFFSEGKVEAYTQFEFPLTINEYRFINLMHSKEAQKYRNPELIKMAKEILPELE